MTEKTRPLGICDHCGEDIPKERWYTSKGRPRLYCSVDCRNTANSQNHRDVLQQRVRERIARGEWTNPAVLNPPTFEHRSAGARRTRLREVEQGTWRNPALDDEAREKLSRPRKHEGALASAIEKMRQGQTMADLTPEEQAAHRAWRKSLRDARRETVNRLKRAWYKRRKHDKSPDSSG